MVNNTHFVRVTPPDVEAGVIETVIDGNKIKVPLTALSMANGIRLKRLGNLSVDIMISFYPDILSFENESTLHPNVPKHWFDKSASDVKPNVTEDKSSPQHYLFLLFFGLMFLLTFYPLILQSMGIDALSGYLADARILSLLPLLGDHKLWYSNEIVAHRAFFIIFTLMAFLIVFYVLEKEAEKIVYNRKKSAVVGYYIRRFVLAVCVIALTFIAFHLSEYDSLKYFFLQPPVHALIILTAASLLFIFFDLNKAAFIQNFNLQVLGFVIVGVSCLMTFYHSHQIYNALYDIEQIVEAAPDQVDFSGNLNAEVVKETASMTNDKLYENAATAITQDDSLTLLLLLNEMKSRRLALPDSYYYIYAKALSERGLHTEAKGYAKYYLKRTQNKGNFTDAAEKICNSSC